MWKFRIRYYNSHTFKAIAVVIAQLISAGSIMLTRIWFTFIDVCLTILSSEARLTVTLVCSNTRNWCVTFLLCVIVFIFCFQLCPKDSKIVISKERYLSTQVASFWQLFISHSFMLISQFGPVNLQMNIILLSHFFKSFVFLPQFAVASIVSC